MTLLEKAQRAKRGIPGRVSTEKWLPAVHVLRSKNWSWSEIYNWLKTEGEAVQECEISFISAMSLRYRNWLTKETRR